MCFLITTLHALSREAFQHYLAQDAFFLGTFAKTYALALAKAGDLGPEVFQTLQELLAGIHEELKLHKSYAQVGRTPLPPFQYSGSVAVLAVTQQGYGVG